MAQCRWCGKKAMFLGSDDNGLCSDCSLIIRKESRVIGNLIKTIEKNLSHAADDDTRIKQCDTIIENVSLLQKYETEHIHTIQPLPSEYVEKYNKIRDNILIESMQNEFEEALSVAEFALSPYGKISYVKEALSHLLDARSILDGTTTPQRIIAFFNQKGGVGKTTSTLNIGAALAKQSRSVLLVDFDPQANLTDGLGIEPDSLEKSVFDLLKGTASLTDIAHKSNGMTLLPSSILLSRAERDFTDNGNSNNILKNILQELRGFQYVLIDCPPSIGFFTLNALMAATHVCIPLQPEYFALKGIRKLLDAVSFIRNNGNPDLSIAGIIGTRYDYRKTLHREVMEKIRGSLDEEVFYDVVRESIALSEASSHGLSIFDYDPGSNGAEDYLRISMELLKREKSALNEPYSEISTT